METKVNEIWKDIPGYEGNYQASTLGRIRSHSRPTRYNSTKKYPSKILAMGSNPRGYQIVCLCMNGKIRAFSVHRLVSMTFISNPNNYKEINHINGDKENNNINNLEWCTSSDNIKHAFKTGLKKNARGGDNYAAKTILNTETGIYYNSIVEAYESTGRPICKSSFYIYLRIGKTKFIHI